jgi:Galactose-3-O-sulfotransferase
MDEPDVERDRSRSGRGHVDVFLHIPKTAGDTLKIILWRQYREVGHLEVADPHQVSDSTVPEDRSFERVKRQVADSLDQFQLIYGHMPFGIHEAIARPSRYFTMLRDPVERAVSHFYYVRREPEHIFHEEVVKGELTIHDYVTSGLAGELANGQTALLAGLEEGAPSSDDAVLRRAQANIEADFAAVGLTEEFDRSIVLFKRALGWDKPIVYRPVNVTTGRPPASALPQATLHAIRAQNELDEVLYRFARERFDVQIAAAGRSMNRELRLLRLGNSAYRYVPTRALRWGWDLTHRRSRRSLDDSPTSQQNSK